MTRLQCPQCSTVVDVPPDTTPVCPSCGFGSTASTPRPAPTPAAAASLPPPAAVPALPFPAAVPTFHAGTSAPARKKRAGLVVGLTLGAVAVLLGGALAAVYLLQPDLLGLGGAGGEVTETEFRSALSNYQQDTTEGSDKAWGMEGSVRVLSGAELPSGGTFSFQVAQDPDEDAFESHFDFSGSGATFSYGLKQRGKVLNFELGTDVFYGRDEDLSTKPSFSNLGLDDAGAGGAPTFDSLLNESTLVIDGMEAVKWKNKPATKFLAHNASTPDEKYEITVYDRTNQLAHVKIDSPEAAGDVDFLYGKEIKISVTTEAPRTSFVLEEEADYDYENFSSVVVQYTVSKQHTHEVKLEEVEMRAIDVGSSSDTMSAPVKARMNLDEGSKTEAGVRFAFEDKDGDGLVSAGDTYEFDAGDTGYQLEFYDLWADAYEGGPVPGFGLWFVVVTLAGLVLVRGGRRG